jgi:hypothetical protein
MQKKRTEEKLSKDTQEHERNIDNYLETAIMTPSPHMYQKD